jgi:hypothetical protein
MEWNSVTSCVAATTLPARPPSEVIEENPMSFLRRRVDAPAAAPGAADPAPRLSRSERRAQRAEQAAAAELAARVSRAQRRLAQATGPLPVAAPRRSSEDAVPSE